MRLLITSFNAYMKVIFIFLIMFSFSYSKPLIVNKELLSSETYSKSTQFYIDKAITHLVIKLEESSLVSLNGMNLFVWKINDGETMKRNNKFSIIIENNIRHMLQAKYKVNVFNLDKISSKNHKGLIKKMGISHILSGVFHKFRDSISLNIEVMTIKESKIIASSSVFIKKSLYKRVIDMGYVGENTEDDYFMKLKGSN